jgi:hypothetical protein
MKTKQQTTSLAVYLFALAAFINGCSMGTDDEGGLHNDSLKDDGEDTDQLIGGPCEYDEISGTVTILSIQPATADDGNLHENGSLSVRYAFTPDDDSISEEQYDVTRFGYNAEKFHQLYIPDLGTLATQECIDLLEIEEGTELKAMRLMITSGACSPVVDEFPDLDTSICAENAEQEDPSRPNEADEPVDDGGWIGGPCQYNEIPGTATIVSIESADSDDGNLCDNGSVSVRYEFVPDDDSLSAEQVDVSRWGFNPERHHQLQIAEIGFLPTQACIDALGIEVGSELSMVRSIIEVGVCTPVIDSFPELDTSSCVDMCAMGQ